MPWPAGWAMGRRCRHDEVQTAPKGVKRCTSMIASNVLPESLADPATSALTAGRKLRWWRDLHSFRWCRSPIEDLRMMWSAQMCLAFKWLHAGSWNAAAGSDERRAHKGEQHAIRSGVRGRPICAAQNDAQ